MENKKNKSLGIGRKNTSNSEEKRKDSKILNEADELNERLEKANIKKSRLNNIENLKREIQNYFNNLYKELENLIRTVKRDNLSFSINYEEPYVIEIIHRSIRLRTEFACETNDFNRFRLLIYSKKNLEIIPLSLANFYSDINDDLIFGFREKSMGTFYNESGLSSFIIERIFNVLSAISTQND